MVEYLSKLQDAASMWWATMGYMERYWTVIGAYLVAWLLIRLIRLLNPPEVRYVEVRRTEAVGQQAP